MKTMHKRLIVGTAIAALLTVPLASSVEARDWRGGGRGGGGHHYYRGGGDNTRAYVALGLGALALGGALAYSATQPAPTYYYAPPPPPTYYAPVPAYSYYPPPVTYYAPPAYYAPGYYDPYTTTYKAYPSYDRGSN